MNEPSRVPDSWRACVPLLILTALLAVGLAPFACEWPDGLERVALDHGVAEAEPLFALALFPEYRVPGLSSERASIAVAGLTGGLAVLAGTFALAWLLVGRGSRRGPGEP